MADINEYMINTDNMFSRRAAEASKDLTIGQFVDWLIVNKPEVQIVGIDMNSGHKDAPLCLRLVGEWK